MTDNPDRDGREVVVGIDGSPSAARALEWAADEALLRGVPLRIVHAWIPPIAAWPFPGGPAALIDSGPLQEAADELVAAAARSVAERLGERAPALSTVATEAAAATGLLAAAASAGLLVVGRRGTGGLPRLLLGSVADAVARHAASPVAVIGATGAHGPGPIVVGVDDSPAAEAAFGWAADEALRLGRKLVVVHGWEAPLAAAAAGGAVPLNVPSHERSTDELVAGLVLRYRSAGGPCPEVERRAVALGASEAVLAAAADAALVVVGSRGRGGFVGLVLGSVSQQCLHHAPCPIVVVHAPAPHPA